ncbi:MAG: exodeoxyribonuclease V subunit gamma, partial [Clostridia bacterium]|nr:exodeoxyribonuclease V subunit gamma [Clostridia bacterium]
MILSVSAYTLSECMDATAQYVTAYEQTGDYNVIFCEDRLTLIAERALTKALGGTFRTSVTTFSRYLQNHEQALSKQGSVMAVGNVMTKLQNEGKLQCFTTLSGVGSYAKSIYETLSQFFASGIDADVLKEAAANLEDDILRKKTSDLALILEGYNAYLQERNLFDESRYLQLLPEKIRADSALKNCNVFFLCYTSFTKQSCETIRAVCQNAKNVIGVFCGGEEDIYTNAAKRRFEDVCKEFGKVKPLNLGQPLAGEAERLRKGLYNPKYAGDSAMRTDKVRIFEAKDKMGEAQYVAVQICRYMQTHADVRFRDFAVLVPSIHEYSLAVKRAFDEYEIPYFIDEKRSLKSHPLARFLLDCFRVVKENYSPLSVQALTSNRFFGDADEYRNYLLKFANYRGGATKAIKTNDAVKKAYPNTEYLEKCRTRLLVATQGIKSAKTGKAYCKAIRDIMSEFQAETEVKRLEEEIEDRAHKGYLSQIYRALDSLLGEAELLLGNKETSVAEFSAVLEDGLDATEISLIPLKADAVFIGDVSQSRIEKVTVLFAMGMTDAVPANAGDTAIVSDQEIQKLQSVRAYLEPTVAEVNVRTRESVCLNLCTFMDEMHFSYPLSADGSEPSVSEIFRSIDDVFTDAQGNPLARRKSWTEEEFAYLCSRPTTAIRRLLLAKGARKRTGLKGTDEYSTLYEALDKLSVLEKDDFLQEMQSVSQIAHANALFFSRGVVSPTALETYFSCPFKLFAERGLKLQEREETAVLAVDTGNFIHELLEECGKQAQKGLTEEEMLAFATKKAQEILEKPIYSAQKDTASGIVFGDKLCKEGVDVAMAMYRQIYQSKFQVEHTEYEMKTDDFYGKVDRVDCADGYVRIIDYKTGKIDDSAAAYYTGRKMQMQLYMSALQGERIPAGVFYFPASIQYEDEGTNRFQMQGFLNGDEKPLLLGDPLLAQKKKSEFFPAGLQNSKSTRVMDE